jgi:hypothetical protein
MARVVCQFTFEPEQVGFTWCEGPDAFPPYQLRDSFLRIFNHRASRARQQLGDLVLTVNSFQEDEGAVRRGAHELASAGHDLYEAIFRPDPEQAHVAKAARSWLEDLRTRGEVESLEIVINGKQAVPWNVVYDEEPGGPADFPADGSAGAWGAFWGLRFNLSGGRRVDPRRRNPFPQKPHVLLVVDPKVRSELPPQHQQRLLTFAERRGLLPLIESRAQLITALRERRADVMYWLCHADPSLLVLGGEDIRPDELVEVCSDRFAGLVFLNACRTGEPGQAGSFFEALYDLRATGLVATEEQTMDVFANEFGLDFLERFLDRGEMVGPLLRELRRRVPLGLLYAAYCPPGLCVGQPVQAAALPGRRGGRPGSRAGAAAPLPEKPYPTLANYDREHRALFVGREEDVQRFVELLDDADTRILVLHAESGVGKTSFLRAGVLPYLEEGDTGYQALRDRSGPEEASQEGPVLFLRATNDLTGQLARALCDYCARPLVFRKPTGDDETVDLPLLLGQLLSASDPPQPPDPSAVRAALRADPALLGRVLAEVSNRLPYTLVLIIDQGEEVFTLAQTAEDAESRRLGLEMLRLAAGTPGDVKIILSLRTEYYGRLVDALRRGPRQARRLRDYLLADFTEDQLVEAITQPTKDETIPYASERPSHKYLFRYEAGVPREVARRVLASAGGRQGVLPLMQVVCHRLYETARYRPDPVVTRDDLDRLGSIEGATQKHVDAVLDALFGDAVNRDAFQKLFARLYRRHADGSLTSGLLPAEELKRRWTGSAPFEYVLRVASAPACRLLRVVTLRREAARQAAPPRPPHRGKFLHRLVSQRREAWEQQYVSLGHDTLARVAARWDEAQKNPYQVRLAISGDGERFRAELFTEDLGDTEGDDLPGDGIRQIRDGSALMPGHVLSTNVAAEVGGRLFELVLDGEVNHRKWHEILASLEGQSGRSLRLLIDAPFLDLPFGLLFDPLERYFLFRPRAGHPPIQFVRTVRYWAPRRLSLNPERKPVRLLVAAAEPEIPDVPPFGCPGLLRRLAAGLAGLPEALDLFLCAPGGARPIGEVVEGAPSQWENEEFAPFCKTSPAVLSAALAGGNFDVLHLLAYGDSAGVALCDADGHAAHVSAAELSAWCCQSHLQMAFLLLCHGSRMRRLWESRDLAETLWTLLNPRGGNLAAVIASPYPLKPVAATKAAVAFYRRLALGESLEAALPRDLDPSNLAWAFLELWVRPQALGARSLSV